jgi:hypothetical protein
VWTFVLRHTVMPGQERLQDGKVSARAGCWIMDFLLLDYCCNYQNFLCFELQNSASGTFWNLATEGYFRGFVGSGFELA